MGRVIQFTKGSLRKIIHSACTILGGTTATNPYVVRYSSDASFRIPETFRLEEYKGLILIGVSSESDSRNGIAAYWTDQSHYQAHGSLLEKELSLKLEGQGFLLSVDIPKKPWWHTFSLKDWIISAAALLTAFAALHAYFAVICEPADVQVAFVDESPVMVTAGTSFTTQINVLNNSAFSATKLTKIQAIAAERNGPRSFILASNWNKIPTVAAGQSTQLTVIGVAPKLETPNGPAESYSINVFVSARTGYLRDEGHSNSVSRELRVWPTKIGWSKPRVVGGAGEKGDQDFAQVAIYVFPGQVYNDGGAGAVLISSRPDEITSLSVSNAIGPLLTSPPADVITHKMEFRTPPLEAFKVFTLSVTLTAKRPLSKSRWAELIAKIEPFVR